MCTLCNHKTFGVCRHPDSLASLYAGDLAWAFGVHTFHPTPFAFSCLSKDAVSDLQICITPLRGLVINKDEVWGKTCSLS